MNTSNMINEKVPTNPELVQINILVGEALDALIERKWGSVKIDFSCQNGRIKTVKVTDDKVFTFKNE
jgi:proline racemase